VDDAVCGAVRAAVRGAVRGAVDDAEDDAVRAAVRVAVGVAVGGAVGGAVDVAVGDAVRAAVRDAMGGVVGGAEGDAVHQAVADVIRRGWSNIIGGQFGVGGWYWGGAYTSFFREVCGLKLAGDLWKRGLAYEATMEAACWWYPHKDFIMVCERPAVIHRELANPAVTRGWRSHRLHCANGPAVAWADGWGVYAIHGVQIPFKRRHIVEHPEQITLAEIEGETNAEIRRVLIERFGMERYIQESGAAVVDHCGADHPLTGLRTARLLRKEVAGDEPIVCLDMLNSTPEPDGSTKRYVIRVDPNAYRGRASKSCLAAMASTYRYADGSPLFKAPEDYAPVAES
jgi:hypothetical protein